MVETIVSHLAETFEEKLMTRKETQGSRIGSALTISRRNEGRSVKAGWTVGVAPETVEDEVDDPGCQIREELQTREDRVDMV
jgi:hypothetical protein